MQDGFYHNTPGYPPARRFRSPPSAIPDANVPGQGPRSREYPGPLRHHVLRGETTHARNGASHGVAYSQASVLPDHQLGMGHDASLQQPPMVQSPRPSSRQLYTAQAPNVPYHQNPEPMIMSGSQSLGLAGVRNTFRGRYYQQRSPNHAVISSSDGSSPQFPVPPRPFDWTGEHFRLPPQMPVPQPLLLGRGKRRALIIGINYACHPNLSLRLKFCLEDAYSMANFLRDDLGFASEDICIMTDDAPWNRPTKANIMGAMKTLVYNAQPQDSLFFYFSGHATYIKDLNGDELSGFDQCICAIDYDGNDRDANSDTPGLIVDDIMHDIMVKPLPEHCRLTAIFDSCHSGTLLDLPHLYHSNGVARNIRHPNRLTVLRTKSSRAHVVSLSASKDNQKAHETRWGGALRCAFIDCMKAFENEVTYKELICYVREYMKSNELPQRPQLSSSYEFDTNLPFII